MGLADCIRKSLCEYVERNRRHERLDLRVTFELVLYVARRIIAAFFVLVGVSIVTFTLINVIPGDPATTMLGGFATEQARETLRHALGLDRPLPVQYWYWVSRVIHLDFGLSYVRGVPVFPLVTQALVNTLILMPISFMVFVGGGVLGGTLAASRRGSWRDHLTTLAALIGTSMPVYWLGLVFIMVFALKLGWFPAGGMQDFFASSGWVDVLHHAVLPAVVAAAIPAGTLARTARASILETINADFVWMLRAKGVPERTIMGKHVLRNAFPPILSMIGLQTGYLLGGQVFAEAVFAWPGVGWLILQSILQRDLLVIQASVLVSACAFIVINLIVDLLYAAVDPRIGHA